MQRCQGLLDPICRQHAGTHGAVARQLHSQRQGLGGGVCEVAAGCRGNRHVQQVHGWKSNQPATQDIGTHSKRTVSSSSLHSLTMYSAQRGSEKHVHRTTCGVETMANSCGQEAGVGPE